MGLADLSCSLDFQEVVDLVECMLDVRATLGRRNRIKLPHDWAENDNRSLAAGLGLAMLHKS